MSVVPVPPRTRWVPDPRGGGRGLRISTHAERELVVLSVWRGPVCVSTVRLPPQEVAAVVAGLVDALADLATDRAAAPDVAAGA